MGMFDYYEPSPPIECPKCGQPMTGWQGKDVLPALFVWRQGVAAPIDQRVDPEVRALPERTATFRVSPTFWIYGGECECGYRFDDSRFSVRCTASDGVWRTTEIEPPPTPCHDVGDGLLQCTNCCEVWPKLENRQLYVCPGCDRLTKLREENPAG